MGGLQQGGSQGLIALAYAPRKPLARTLAIAWSYARPSRGVVGSGKGAHIRAQLRDDDFGDGLAHAGDGVQMPNRLLKREASSLNLLVERLDAFFQGIYQRQQMGKDKALTVGKAAGEGLPPNQLLTGPLPPRRLVVGHP